MTAATSRPQGLQHLRARYYDPATGRFLSQDPLPLLHRYPYAGNNPANFIDPSGLYDTRAAAAVLVAAAATAGPGAAAAAYLAAAMILRDPCWITHAFCPHPPFNWKALNRVVRPVANYLSDAENLAGLGQIAATAGIIAFCAGTVGVGCVAAVGAYAAFTGVKVIYGDSTHERLFHVQRP